MPVCRPCGKYSNVMYGDSCPYCGQMDWAAESHYTPKDYKPDLNLSCGNCKAIRVFSGEPLKCNVCVWVLNTPEPSRAPSIVTSSKHNKAPDGAGAAGVVVGGLGCLIFVTLTFGALWLLIAIIKWMWTNS